MMDEFEGLQQVLSLANPPIEMLGPSTRRPSSRASPTTGLPSCAAIYPDRFPAYHRVDADMNNVDACVREADRAIVELGAKGIQIFTNVLRQTLECSGVPSDFPQHGETRPARVDPPDPRTAVLRLRVRKGLRERDLVLPSAGRTRRPPA